MSAAPTSQRSVPSVPASRWQPGLVRWDGVDGIVNMDSVLGAVENALRLELEKAVPDVDRHDFLKIAKYTAEVIEGAACVDLEEDDLHQQPTTLEIQYVEATDNDGNVIEGGMTDIVVVKTFRNCESQEEMCGNEIILDARYEGVDSVERLHEVWEYLTTVAEDLMVDVSTMKPLPRAGGGEDSDDDDEEDEDVDVPLVCPRFNARVLDAAAAAAAVALSKSA